MKKLVVSRRKAAEGLVAARIDLRVMMVLCCFAAAVMAFAATPDWWSQRGVLKAGVEANDYAAVNQGQLKNMAKAARDELLARGLISSGHAIDVMVESWRNSTANAKDYAPANVGQLKKVAKPFYDLLQQSYPWSAAGDDDKDYAIANLGQLKRVFNFLVLKPLVLTSGDVTATSVALSWQNTNTLVQGFRIERSTDGITFATAASVAQTATSYTDSTGLTENTVYYYRVIATQSAQESPPSNVVQVRTLYGAPTAPTAITISSPSAHGMRVSWTAGGTNQLYYQVQAGVAAPSGDVTWTTVASVASGTTIADVSGLMEKTTYQVRVGAYNLAGLAYSSEVSQRTLPETPAAPGALSITNPAATSATLGWSDASNNETGFLVEQSANAGTSWTTVTTTAANVTGYSVTGLTGTVAYQFRVTACNQDGNTLAKSAPSSAASLVALPGTPTSLSATPSAWDTVQLTWSLPTATTGVHVRGFLFGQSDSRADVNLPAGTLSWQDTELEASTHYQYQVKAVNERGESAAATVDATTPTNLPTPPTNVAGTASGSRTVTVTWTNGTGSNVDSLVVERSVDVNSGPWIVSSASLPASAVSYTVTGLQGDTSYFFRIRAVNSHGEAFSAVSAEVKTNPYAGANHVPDSLAVNPLLQGQLGLSLVPYLGVPWQAQDARDQLAASWWVWPATYTVNGGPATVVLPNIVDLSSGSAVYDDPLVSDDAWDASAEYGKKVVISGNHIFVSAPNARKDPNNASSVRCGAVSVFEWNGSGSAALVARLVPSDGAAGDRFGDALAADGDRAIIGAPLANEGGHADAGRAYLYELVSGTWQRNRTEVSTSLEDNLQFGFSIALRGRQFVIGAPNQNIDGLFLATDMILATTVTDGGRIYFGQWDQAAGMLTPQDNPMATNGLGYVHSSYAAGLNGSHFGASVAMDPTLQVTVGAPDHTWTSTQTLMASFWGGSMFKFYWNGGLNTEFKGLYVRLSPSGQGINAGVGRTMKWNRFDQAVYFTEDHPSWYASGAAGAQLQVAPFALSGTRTVDLRGYDPDSDPLTYTPITGSSTTAMFNGSNVLTTAGSDFQVIQDQSTGFPYLQPKAGANLITGAVYSVGVRVADDRGGSKDFNFLVKIGGDPVNEADYQAWLALHHLTSADSGRSIGGDGLTTRDKYLRYKAGFTFGVNPETWDLDPNDDYDGDKVLNKEDADAFDASIGRLQILVTQPADNTSL